MKKTELATFAAGCFWGVQFYFDRVPGVTSSRVGYTGGHKSDPTYEEVCAGNTGHAEAVELSFNPEEIKYSTLVRHFFRIHDPTQLNRQGPDVGENYRSVIFFHSSEQQNTAEKIMKKIEANYEKPIATSLEEAGVFYEAESYHQKYSEGTGMGMCHLPYKSVD
jgi:methionine-S-sulfoxide reductase